MQLFELKMARSGGGSGVFLVRVNASTPDEARRAAEGQNPGYSAIAVRAAPRAS